jgi:hypothetical protein
MTKSSLDKTLGIYVPSYKRSDSIITYKFLKNCTYVVRKSEKQLYKDAGVERVLAVPDEEINSFAKVRQWIIDNTPEDIVVQIDDDITCFSYAHKETFEAITDEEVAYTELERVAQLLSDLELGFASIRMTVSTLTYNSEFSFSATLGMVCWYNKSALKGRYDEKVTTKCDMDFQLQELLHNRIILVPSYLRAKGLYDKNKSGNNIGKTSEKVRQNVDYLKLKWGRYFKHNYQKNISRVVVKR